MANDIIEMKHITKKFPGIIANDDISLSIKKGEIFALLGENGAGKSTLMSILFGMYEPDEGTIHIRGKKEKITSPNYATSLNIGMVHQHFKLVDNYTITENVILGIEPRTRLLGFIPYLNTKKVNKTIKQLSLEYNLEVDPLKKIEEVPVSIRQRVEIIKMLYRKAEILIFDEPTAVLTPQEIESFLEILQGLKKTGKTIILITHKLEEIKKTADRCAILCKGKLVDILNVAQTSTKLMANLMVGRDVSFNLQKTKPNIGKKILEIKNLTILGNEGFTLVKNVNFSIHAGEILALAGVSGNGQLELVEAIMGLIKIKRGSILLNGENIIRNTVKQRILKGISFIPEDRQNDGLIMDFSLSENLILKKYYQTPFNKRGIINDNECVSYANKLIQQYDIRSSKGAQTLARSMSGGNQQKAIIAREIECDSQLLIFVQPTRGLDIGAIEKIHEQIIEQRNKNKAILLVSLELDEIMKCADTIAVMYNGEMQSIQKASELNYKQVGEYMMGIKKHDNLKAR